MINIISLIDKKVAEHKKEIELTDLEKQKLESLGKKSLTKRDKSCILMVSELLTLKDKILFHKSAILTLEDLKNDLENYKL